MKFNILDRSLDVFQTRFLEASAGTGKTFAIEHLYVRLLIEGKTPLTVEEILAVTFTKAATRELKMRIRTNMETALSHLEEGVSSLDYLQSHLEQGAKPAIFRLRAALGSLDQMQIFTIHGFCHKMLSEHAFEGHTPIELNDPDSGAHKKSLRQLVMDFFRTGLHKSAYSPAQLLLMLKTHEHLLSKLSQTILELLEKGTPIAEYPCFTTLLKDFNAKLFAFPVIELSLFLEDFEATRANYKNMTHLSFPLQARLLGKFLEKRSSTEEEFDQLLSADPFFLEQMHKDNLKVRLKPVNCHYPQLFEKLHAEVLPLLLKARDPSLNILRIVRSCQELWLKKNLKVFPDELLKKMAKCLQNPQFLARTSQKYRAAIIDEFQDTDPTQWEIFRLLFLKKACAFYLVGDPKQSIYAFRNADVKTYLQAKTEVPKEACAFLDTNFRAMPSLVEALNHLFLFSPHWLGKIELLRVSAGKTEETFPVSDEKGRVHFFISEQKKTDLFFPFIAREIQKLQPYGSCAILVKGRHQATEMHAFLKKWGISSAIKRAENLLESPAFALMYDLVQAVKTPRNLTAVRRVLASPLFGWTAEEIEKSSLADARLFHKWHHLEQEHGFEAMIGDFLSNCPLDPAWGGAFRQWIEKILQSKEDPLVFLEEMRTKIPDEEEEEFKVRPEVEENKVQIMTTHVSKGLEFDFVFALGVASRHNKRDPFLKVNNHLVRLDPEDPDCESALQELESEKLRQFYVALTRAKQRIYVALALDPKDPNGNSPAQLFCRHLGGNLYAALDALKERSSLSYSILNEQTFTLKKQMQVAQEESLLPSTPISWEPYPIASFSSLAIKHATTPVSLPEGDLPSGAETGHLLHRILEKGVAEPDSLSTFISQETIETALAGYEEKIFSLLSPLFDLPLGNEEDFFTLRSLPKETLFQEMEFLFTQEDNLIKGFIDLVIIRKNKFYFIDWKSNLLPDYTLATLKQAMHDANYFLQADLYKQALTRYFSHFSLSFGGAFYIFLRGPALYPIY